MSTLRSKRCVPCAPGARSLDAAECSRLLGEISGWSVVESKRLSKELRFPDFISALGFVNDVGRVAEEENHHPDIYLAWGRVRLEIWTHTVGGLSENDFILAAKIDALRAP